MAVRCRHGLGRYAACGGRICFGMVTNTSALTGVMDGPDGILAGLKASLIHVDKPGYVQRGCL